MTPTLLIADDEKATRDGLRAALEEEFDVFTASNVAEAMSVLNSEPIDLLLTDLRMGGDSGMDLLDGALSLPNPPVSIMMTAYGSVDTAVEAMRRGAWHFVTKPLNLDEVEMLLKRALRSRKLETENKQLRAQISDESGLDRLAGKSPAIRKVTEIVRQVAPTRATVLIEGESGTGKEVVADMIHTLSKRDKGPFIKINCAALPRDLIESELFGSVKGSFTGATEDRKGLFRQAEGGTLLLDELSEMPIDTQSKLLRVLQEKEVRPVGGRTSFKTDCRIIASTNRIPEDAIKDGKLREDLYYRISAIKIHLPPLRDRRDDILPLARAFLKRFAAQANRVLSDFTNEACERLRRYDWPGNVRQLQNEIQRTVLMCEGQLVEPTDLSVSETAGGPGDPSSDNLTLMEAMERNKIVEVLRETGGNKLETAKRLGIGRQTLYNKIKAYQIAA